MMKSIFALAFAAGTVLGALPALAQTTWQAHGAWRVVLEPNSARGPLCMLTGMGTDPHAFGILVTSGKDLLLFGIDDRTAGVPYHPQMSVVADGATLGTFDTFNDPPMTSTEPGSAAAVRELIARLTTAQTLTVRARGLDYRLDLTGFADAAKDLAACESSRA